MRTVQKILVTGGAGFIGSNFVLQWLEGGGDANAVLIRAVEPLPDSLPWLHASARGPGNVCKAFGIARQVGCACPAISFL